MDFIEGSVLKFTVVAKNAAGRILPPPVDLTVQYNGMYLSPDPMGVYSVSEAGQVTAATGSVQVVEPVNVIPDETVATLVLVKV
jgi:hypothetical protein